jgi:hypothetical protein
MKVLRRVIAATVKREKETEKEAGDGRNQFLEAFFNLGIVERRYGGR